MPIAGRLPPQRESLSPSEFDICVVGHITGDIITIGHTTRAIPGGTAYYTSVALRRLGLKVAVVTKVAKGDVVSLLRDLRRE